MLTARSVEGQWLTDITDTLTDDRHPYLPEVIGLPSQHPHALDVYLRTVAALRPVPEDATVPMQYPVPVHAIRWKTLDFVQPIADHGCQGRCRTGQPDPLVCKPSEGG